MMLTVPPYIEAVITEADTSSDYKRLSNISGSIGAVRKNSDEISPEENKGAWAEALAFSLVPHSFRKDTSCWNTYFGPLCSGTYENGKPFVSPDIADADAEIVEHWGSRAKSITNPLLKARYADLVWDLGKTITGAAKSPEMAILACDAYLAIITKWPESDLLHRFGYAKRALDLAVQIRDADRINAARAAILQLHREGIVAGKKLWWEAYRHLTMRKSCGLTQDEFDSLIQDLEGVVEYFSNQDPKQFNPHDTDNAAKMLITHYEKLGRRADVVRLHSVVAKTYEFFASISDPMVALSVLPDAIKAYKKAGLKDEAKKLTVALEGQVSKSKDQMQSFTETTTVPRDVIDKYVKDIVVEDLGKTLLNIAKRFLINKQQLEEMVQSTVKDAPLMAHIGFSIMDENHVVAKVGSVEDDPYGRLIHQSVLYNQLSYLWLRVVFDSARDTHALTVNDLISWVNMNGLYPDTMLLEQGFQAWLDEDYVKACHILVPQVEYGLRAMVSQLGRPITEADPQVDGASVVVGMGRILNNKVIAAELDTSIPNLSLHLITLFSDPRGMNIRNQIAHGLMHAQSITGHLANLIVHTLILYGPWRTPNELNNPPPDEKKENYA